MNPPEEIKVECPACGQAIELPEAEARTGVVCPTCTRVFLPTIAKSKADAIREQQIKLGQLTLPSGTSAERVRRMAQNFSIASAIAGLIGAVILLFSIFSAGAGNNALDGYICGGSLISLALWLFLIAQIVHIRANTEK